MIIEIAIALLLGFILLYLVFVNLFIVLFRLSGITKEKSKFQVISMVTRIGLTSLDNEEFSKDKGKRRLAIVYLVAGNIFSVITVALVVNVLACINNHTGHTLKNMAVVFGIFIAIIAIYNLPFVKGTIDLKVERRAQNIPSKDVDDNIISLLENYNKNAIMEVYINSVPRILVNRSLSDSKIKEKYNVRIMIIKRKNTFIEATKDSVIQKGDLLVVFGTLENVKNVFVKAEKDMSAVLHSLLSFKKENIVTLIDNYGTDAMAEVKINTIPEVLKGVVLEADMLKKKYDFILLSIKRNDENLEKPNEAIIDVDDVVVIFGSYANIKSVFLNIE